MATWAKLSTRVKEHKGAEGRQNENYRTLLSLGDIPHLKVFSHPIDLHELAIMETY